jgi:hypothetical protein
MKFTIPGCENIELREENLRSYEDGSSCLISNAYVTDISSNTEKMKNGVYESEKKSVINTSIVQFKPPKHVFQQTQKL